MLSSHLRCYLLAGWTLVAATPLCAVDGVIEINQARALAGGVVPGDGAGFPVVIDASGSYRLTSDLTVAAASTTAILVVAPARHVAIDLNGFAIVGPVACGGEPTSCPAASTGDGIASNTASARLEVSNGFVRGMGRHGVSTTGQLAAHAVWAIGNAGSGFSAGADSVLSDCLADHNGAAGIVVFASSDVRGCSAVGNVGIGIDTGSRSLVSESLALGNGGIGIHTDDGGTVTSSVASSNGGYGIEVGLGGSVTDSVARANDQQGVKTGATGAYGRNVLAENNGGNDQAQAQGFLAPAIELGPNVCGDDTDCP